MRRNVGTEYTDHYPQQQLVPVSGAPSVRESIYYSHALLSSRWDPVYSKSIVVIAALRLVHQLVREKTVPNELAQPRQRDVW